MSLYIGDTKIGKVIVGTQESGGGINTDDATLTSGAQMLYPYTAYSKGVKHTGSILTRTDSNLSVSGNTVTAAAGYYAETASKSVPTVTLADPTISVNANGLITAAVSQSAGYVETSQSSNTKQLSTQAAKTITPGDSAQTAVQAGLFTTGNVIVAAVNADETTITANGTYTPESGEYFNSVVVNVPTGGGTVSLQDKTNISPLTTSQTIRADAGYDGLSSVQINAMPTGTAGTPTASKGTVSNHAISITPSVTNTTGYITGGTKTGTAVSVSASELVSGTKSITANGTGIDVTNYSSVDVSVPSDAPALQSKSIDPTESVQTVTADSGYGGLSSVEVGAISSTYIGSDITQRSSTDMTASGATVTAPAGYYPASASKSVASGTVTAPSSISGASATVSTGSNTLTLTKTVSVTPNVSAAGYISSGTAGNSSISLTANVTTKGATTYNTSSSDQTISSGQYLTGVQTIKAVTVSGLSADSILSGVTVKVGDANDDDRIASVTGTVVIQHYYTGSSSPSSSLGDDGDVFLMTGA